MLVDLTRPLTAGMTVYPGDPQVSVESALTLPMDGVSVHRLGCGTHTGTHLDAPAHTEPGARTVEEVPLERLVGPTLVLDARGSADGAIGRSWLAGVCPERVPERVFIATGWADHFGTPSAGEHPWIELAVVQELWRRGLRLLGVDALSPDRSDDLPVHRFVLGQDGLIVENLTNPPRLLGDEPAVLVDACIAPLPWVGVDGSPVRAWAEQPD